MLYLYREDHNGHGRGGRGARGGGRGARGGRGASTTGQQLAISPAATQAPPPPPQLGEFMGFAERLFDRTLTALSNDRREHLSTINTFASRLSTPLTQQTQPPPLPQQALLPPPQQALLLPPSFYDSPARYSAFIFGVSPAKDPPSEQRDG